MDYAVPTEFGDLLPQCIVGLLDGGRRYVHQNSPALTWRFGTLCQSNSGMFVRFPDAQHLPQPTPFLPLAVSDDGNALVCLSLALDCAIWYHDNGELDSQRVQLEDWLSKANRVDLGVVTNETMNLEMPIELIGVWMPVRVLTPGSAGILKMLPAEEFTSDGRWIERPRKRGSAREFVIESLSLDPISLTSQRNGEFMSWTVEFESDDEIVITGPQPDFQVRYRRESVTMTPSSEVSIRR